MAVQIIIRKGVHFDIAEPKCKISIIYIFSLLSKTFFKDSFETQFLIQKFFCRKRSLTAKFIMQSCGVKMNPYKHTGDKFDLGIQTKERPYY